MNTAVIDIGSNTVKITVFSEDDRKIFTDTRPLGLIGRMNSSAISAEGLDALVSLLKQFEKSALENRCRKENIFPFATAAIRGASNREDIVREVKERTGLCIDVITGEKEALLSYSGMLFSNDFISEKGVLTDLGGGSCEVIRFDRSKDSPDVISLRTGALSLYKRFEKDIHGDIPDSGTLSLMSEYFSSFTENLMPAQGEVYALGGTVRAIRTMCSLCGKKEAVPFKITKDELSRLASFIISRKKDAEGLLRSAVPERVRTFAPGIVIYSGLLRAFGKESLTVVEGGAREGYYLMIKKGTERSAG